MSYARTFIICLSCLWLPTTVAAHPVSHTDAWIRVSDSVDVKLNVFLDDVLRHQSLLDGGATSIPSSVVANAIEAHSATLLRQLQIFDQQGIPLTGRITSQPKWNVSSNNVDLSVDASLKLTWKITFEQAKPLPLNRLSFLHHFTHPSLESKGELRLHLLDTTSQRRIDAVVPPEQLHTIILPDRTSELTAFDVSARSAANQLTARLVAGPTHVNIEFESPLLLMNVAWPQAKEFTRNAVAVSDNAGGQSLDATQARIVRETIESWFGANVESFINNQRVTADRIIVEFVRPDIATTPDDETRAFEPISVFGTNIGARLSYRRGLNLDDVKFILKDNPGDSMSEVHVHVSAQNQRLSEVRDIAIEQPEPNHAFEFDWTSQHSAELPSRFAKPTHHGFLDKRTTYPGIGGAVGSVVIFAIWGWAAFRQPRLRNGFLPKKWVSMAAMVTGFLPCAFFPDVRFNIDQPQLANTMTNHLSGIYAALQLDDEELTVTALGTILDEDIRERTYLEAVESVTSASDEPLTSLRAISLTDCEVAAPFNDREVTTFCRWTVEATVEHWGHAHDRKLMFEAQIILVEADNQWKIGEFRTVSSKTVLPESQAKTQS